MAQSNDYVGGLHAVTSLLEAGQPIIEIWLAKQRRNDERTQQLLALAKRQQIAVQMVAPTKLDALLPEVNHQGCVARLAAQKAYQESDLPDLIAQAQRPWILALDQVQDPHNLGACLRSAAAAGVTAVIAPRKRAAGLTATVRKIAVGATEQVPFIQVSNLARAIQRLQKDGFWATGLAGEAEQSIYAADLTGPIIVVMGGEAKGLRQRTREVCDHLAAIPMMGAMESLNVSVATGITLFEAVRQRQ